MEQLVARWASYLEKNEFFILIYRIKNFMEYKCKFCDKFCLNANSLAQHQIRCSKNPNKIITKISDETKQKLSKVMKVANTNSSRIWKKESREKRGVASKEFNSKYWSSENREKHSNLMKSVVKKFPESYSTNNVSGRAKIYEYDGIKLKGTWELQVAKAFDSCNIKWTNDIKPFPYFWKNKWHLYFPDFYLIEYDLYVEVKGYQRDRDLSKWKVLDNLLILKDKELKELKLDYKKIIEIIQYSIEMGIKRG